MRVRALAGSAAAAACLGVLLPAAPAAAAASSARPEGSYYVIVVGPDASRCIVVNLPAQLPAGAHLLPLTAVTQPQLCLKRSRW